MPEAIAYDLFALGSVVLIDLALASDNAVVIGMVAGRLTPEIRLQAIAIGILLAIGCRILFAIFAVQLLAVVGLLFVGGLLLLWVAWKLWRLSARECPVPEDGTAAPAMCALGYWGAVGQIAIADVTLSLDNVLAVAGAARHNLWIMAAGIALSVLLMAVAATAVAGLLDRRPWLSHVGVALIAAVALSMIYEGATDLLEWV